jgi:hypothetical protein
MGLTDARTDHSIATILRERPDFVGANTDSIEFAGFPPSMVPSHPRG